MREYSASELYHHGILGMKWGVRRYQNEDGSYTDAGLRRKRKVDNISVKARIKEINRVQYERARTTDINSLSDSDLVKLNNRIQQENTYKNSISPSKKANGKKAVGEVLGSAGKKAATAIATATALYAGRQLLTKFGGEKLGRIFDNVIKKK